MAQRKVTEIVPFDIRGFRQTVGLTQQQLGIRVAEYINCAGASHVPSSRINEWERHVRPIPNDVYVACAKILVDMWVRARAGKPGELCAVIDPKFASLLSPALAKALELEYDYRDRKDKRCREIHMRAKKVREAVQGQLEALLQISLKAVFPEASPA